MNSFLSAIAGHLHFLYFLKCIFHMSRTFVQFYLIWVKVSILVHVGIVIVLSLKFNHKARKKIRV
ncbi:hypothetical protein D0469_00095 [Peribacillus saganii]|uniref:Uncharacterized protein n=1 Tax=Peribacillus saganii TaxID=2303992 RepID=A0A372LTM7_9BACI|nr:hypothetical protein D0469_00095 [Peribacillus saganii]